MGRFVYPLLLLLLFLLRVCFSRVARVCLLFAPLLVVGSLSGSGSCDDLVAQAPCLDLFFVNVLFVVGSVFPLCFVFAFIRRPDD